MVLFITSFNPFLITSSKSLSAFTPVNSSNSRTPFLDELFNNKVTDLDKRDKVVIHTFRHTFASHLEINETPILTIKKLMNHTNLVCVVV